MIEELTARGVLVKQLEDAFLQTYFRTEIPGSAPLSLRFGVCEAASILQRRVDNRGAVWRTLQTTRGALSMIHTKIDAARKAAGEHMSEEEIAAFKELATDLDLARSLTEDLAADFKKKQDSDKARARAARHGSPKPQAKKKPGRKEKPDLV